jgi:hypothetical protein
MTSRIKHLQRNREFSGEDSPVLAVEGITVLPDGSEKHDLPCKLYKLARRPSLW